MTDREQYDPEKTDSQGIPLNATKLLLPTYMLDDLRRKTLNEYHRCERGETEDVYFEWENTLFVNCSDLCMALQNPGDNVDELKRSLEHWKHHGVSGGCSHGN